MNKNTLKNSLKKGWNFLRRWKDDKKFLVEVERVFTTINSAKQNEFNVKLIIRSFGEMISKSNCSPEIIMKNFFNCQNIF